MSSTPEQRQPQLRPAEATIGAGIPSFPQNSETQAPETGILEARSGGYPVKGSRLSRFGTMLGIGGGNRPVLETTPTLPTPGRAGGIPRTPGGTTAEGGRDPRKHTRRNVVMGIVAGGGLLAGGGIAARVAMSGEGSSGPRPTPESTVPGGALGTPEPGKTAKATATPTEVAPTPNPEYLPFKVGVSHTYAGGLLETVLDENLLTAHESTYVTKGNLIKKVSLPAISDFFISLESVPALLAFSQELQYDRWVFEDPSRSGVTLEKVIQAWNQGIDSVDGLSIPRLKTLVLGKIATPEPLQIEVNVDRSIGYRETENKIALIDFGSVPGEETADKRPTISESGFSLAGALLVFGDFIKGGQLSTVNKTSDKGMHYWNDLVPLANTYKNNYLKNGNEIQIAVTP